MAAILEPKAPGKGWVIRWAAQSSDLLLRIFPAFLAVTVLANLVFGYVVLTVLGLPLDPMGSRYAQVAVSACICLTYLFWVIHAVMREDGHDPAMPLFSLDGIRGVAGLLAV